MGNSQRPRELVWGSLVSSDSTRIGNLTCPKVLLHDLDIHVWHSLYVTRQPRRLGRFLDV